jgi:diadenosine tetraphosphate (Ap4A) HIT family hydrolase
MIKQERALYERFSFVESDNKIVENGIPACQMKKPPSGRRKGYSFHHDYPGYMEWMDEKKCPFCNHEPVWSDHVLIKELKHSSVHASMKAQGRLWGKCVVLCKKHYIELYELPPNEMSGFMTDVQKTAKALKEVSGAVKINLELHGNTIPHLHIHLFPRYLDDLYTGKAIDYNNTEPSPYESKAEYDYFIEQMRLKLSV